MHRRVLATDWSATSIGPIDRWSPALRTAAALCLASRVPMVLVMGADLVMLYNDAYSAMLGARHPVALGGRWDRVWADVWTSSVRSPSAASPASPPSTRTCHC
jgi:hypothetical protein